MCLIAPLTFATLMNAKHCLCFLLLLLCSPHNAAAENVRLRVGVVVPLSGPVAEYGTAIRNGLELAQTDNEQLRKQIEFVFEDHYYDNKAAISAINKLAAANDVDLVYLWGYGMCQAAIPAAEAQRLPTVAVTAEDGINTGRKYVLRFSYRAKQLAEAILAYLRSRQIRQIGLVQTDIAFIKAISDGIIAGIRQDEAAELVDSFVIGEGDFRSTINKLKGRSFAILGVLLAPGQVSEFFKQADALRYKVPAFGASPFESSSEIARANGLMENAVFPGLDISDDFAQRYIVLHGQDNQLGWAANAYDFGLILARVAENLREQKTRGIALLEQFRKIEYFDGAEGRIRFKADPKYGDGFEFPVVMKRISGKSYTVIPESRNWN